MDADEKLNCCKYMLRALLPILKLIHEEQDMERVAEANIQGALHNLVHCFPVFVVRF